MGSLPWNYSFLLILICSYTNKQLSYASFIQPSYPDLEKLALLQFRQSFVINCDFSDSLSVVPKTKTWSDEPDKDFCSWNGVECNEDTGHVIGLDLSSACLYGNFPPNSTLFNLAHLEYLNLAFNDFNYSRIPSQIGQINKLKSLNLSHSSFSGQLPSEISKLSELHTLDLSNNGGSLANSQLDLKITDSSLEELIHNLTHIEYLYLDMVDLSSTVPIMLTNLTSLKAISLAYCNLYGKVPMRLFQLPQLEILQLSGNRDLGGLLPRFESYSPLKKLYLYGTSFSGKVPSSIGKLAHLEELDLCSCFFSGSLPSTLANMTKLTVLLLSKNNFRGEVSFSITNLTNLEALDFSNIEVTPKEFFSQLSKLHNLVYLRLAEMNLGTEMPSFIANLSKLTYLDLAASEIMGPLPQWLVNLTELRQLYLESNHLEGPIPLWFSQLQNLHSLNLSSNNLYGMFDIFFSLKNLRTLALSQLNLTFPHSKTNSTAFQLQLLELAFCNLNEFPQFLKHQNELQSISLGGNNIKGTIPQWLVNITKQSLLIIDLSENNLTGFEQPGAVLPWTYLEKFHFKGNKLQGSVPTPPKFVKFYDASNNLLTGTIPKQICNAKSLISLDLSGNNLIGEIPGCIGNELESLELLDLRGNNLHGNIPTTFTKFCKLKMINLSHNQLRGELPRSLANCTMLEVVDFGKNHLSDSFPTWLGNLTKLQVLVLSHNRFHGDIRYPKSGPSFNFLRVIDLSHNLHTGQLPFRYIQNWMKMKVSTDDQPGSYNTLITFYFEVGTDLVISEQDFEYSITITNKGNEMFYPKVLRVFKVIDFSSNYFTGEIPDDIGNLKGLQALNLSNNNIEGQIPPSLTNITNLESLDLSHNKLSGTIPEALSQLTSLEVFNISHNHLMGPIPQGNQFNTFDETSYQGNIGLCGSPLLKMCTEAATESSSAAEKINPKGEDSALIDWLIRTLGCISGIIIGFFIGKTYITDKYHEWFIETFGRERPRRRTRRARRHVLNVAPIM